MLEPPDSIDAYAMDCGGAFQWPKRYQRSKGVCFYCSRGLWTL